MQFPKSIFVHLMRTIARYVAIGTSVFFVGASTAQTLVASFTPIANFAYQLDCVTGLLFSCAGRGDYEKLWREAFKVDPSTSIEVKRWRELRKAHERLVMPGFTSPEPGWAFSAVSPANRALAAGLGARDLADYQSRLALLMHDSHSVEAAELVATLYKPFARWWSTNAAPPGNTKAQELIARIARKDIREELRTVNALYGDPEGARRQATVHLMYRPGLINPHSTTGQNIGVESFAEFLPERSVADTVPVIVHEYAHFVFGTTPVTQIRALRNAILKQGGDIGGPAWGLLNEALASAIGNGRTQRMLVSTEAFARYAATEGTFYSNALIDGAGKALLSIIDQMVQEKITIHDAKFAARYVDTLKRVFGSVLNSPAAHLNEMVVAIDPSINGDRLFELWRKYMQPSSYWDYRRTACCEKKFVDDMNSQNGVARVAVIPGAAIERAGFIAPAARTALLTDVANRGSGIYVSRKAGEPPLVVIAFGDTIDATIGRTVAALIAAEELREGTIAAGK
jgi:hypothetical protein